MRPGNLITPAIKKNYFWLRQIYGIWDMLEIQIVGTNKI